jgi:hypothetical protein
MAQSETLTGCARLFEPHLLAGPATPLWAPGEGGFVAGRRTGRARPRRTLFATADSVERNLTRDFMVGQPGALVLELLQCQASNVYSDAVQTADVDEKDRRA